MNIFTLLKPIFMKFENYFEYPNFRFGNNISFSFHTAGEYRGGVFFFLNRSLNILAEFHKIFSYKKINDVLRKIGVS